ncbi:MAG TPA: DUF58 domain-containing protein [Candidatus Sulfotelmatobacter sp.]|nr:DUF58 domain-containing protein [Candidatus Sulfotelmatobacter sp.]
MNLFQTVQQEVIERLGNISVTARQAVESVLAGQHRSVRRGLSVEFAGHREYQPGDDLRHLDWLVYARSDRYDIRQYEEETKLRATIILDTSGSMGYASGKQTKLAYAQALTAALGFLMIRQSDAVGLVTCDTAVRDFIPPGSTMPHFLNVLAALEKTRPGNETSLAPVLNEVAARLSRRGLVILITDAFDETEAFLQSVQYLRYRKQEVRLFQILDPQEQTFPFKGMIEFVGLEQEPRLKLDGDRVRQHYQQVFTAHQKRLEAGCHACGVHWETCWTNEELFAVLIRTLTWQ